MSQFPVDPRRLGEVGYYDPRRETPRTGPSGVVDEDATHAVFPVPATTGILRVPATVSDSHALHVQLHDDYRAQLERAVGPSTLFPEWDDRARQAFGLRAYCRNGFREARARLRAAWTVLRHGEERY